MNDPNRTDKNGKRQMEERRKSDEQSSRGILNLMLDGEKEMQMALSPRVLGNRAEKRAKRVIPQTLLTIHSQSGRK
jgi:hypothetical protein